MNSYKMQSNKFISLMIAFVMVFSIILPTASLAMEKSTPEGVAIRNEEDLRNIKLGDQSVYYLANDIELTKEWSTLGSFSGKLDGNGYKITNLNITQGKNDGYDAYNYGLFAEIVGSGEVRNLGIEGSVNISEKNLDENAVGISAGLLAGIISNDYYNPSNEARIKNCYVIGEIISDSKLTQQYLGGLTGVYNGGIGDNCYSAVKGVSMIGTTSSSAISNFYYNKDLYTKGSSNSNIVGKTTEEMKSQEFVDSLNKNNGDNPKFKLDEDNYPRQEFIEVDSKPVEDIEIYTEEDLKNINNNLSANYILMNDIELSSENWTMIGSNSTPFSGTLDGNGYVIKNFNYTGKDKYIGFISVSSGKVKNLGMENAKVEATGFSNDDTGAIVGTNNGIIENCYVINSVVTPTKYTYRSGLIAGSNINGTIKNCYASGSGTKGGIAVGLAPDGSNNYKNCYYDKDIFEKEPTSKPSGVVGKTTEEMKSIEFTTLLNSNKGDNLKWYSKEDNYPSMKEPTYDGPSNEDIEANNKLTNELRGNISDSLLNTTDPWAIISMVANNQKDKLTNIDKFKEEAFNNIKDSNGKDAYTIERYIIALSALGIDATKLSNGSGSINAVEYLGNIANDLINSMIFELVAYDSGVYELPSTAKYSKEELINNILNKQTSKGGWSFSGRSEEVDMTAMAIHALSTYYNAESSTKAGISEETYNKVKTSVNKAIDLLGEMKLEDGSYSTDTNASNSNSNSTSMVIAALSALGIDVQQDTRFVKYNKTPIDGLIKFMTENKSGFGFRNNTYNAMATEQGFRALVSYLKFKDTKKAYNIYQCNGGILDKVEPSEPEVPEVPETPEVPEVPEVNEAPVISASNLELNVGDTFEPMKNVTATDKEDGPITKDIEIVENTVDTTKAGNYKVIYKVTDSKGLETIKEIKVIVRDIEVEQGIIKVGIYTDENALYESIKVEFKENDTAYTVLKRILGDKVVSRGEETSLYVESIDGLGEFDKGPLSGWVYAVNRSKPGVSAGEYKLENGDELVWHYTLDLGEDINNSFSKFDKYIEENEKEESPEEKPEQKPDPTPEETPTIDGVTIDGGDGTLQSPVNISATTEIGLNKLLEEIEKQYSVTIVGKPVADGEYLIYTMKLVNKLSKSTDSYIEIKIKNTDSMIEILDKYKEIVNIVDISVLLKSVSNWILSNLVNPSYGDEWMVLGLARGDIKVPNGFYETYYNNLVKEVKEKKGILHRSKYTEYSRVIITLSALGYDPTNVGGYNLVEKLYDYNNVSKQGINGTIFALIALDSKNYEIKGNSNSREMLINDIVSKQLSDGGFNLTGNTGDVDITAMAVQALARYKDDDKVKSSLESAVSFLSKSQLLTGGFGNNEGENVESSSQVLIALNALNISINDKRFVKEGKTIIDAISRFEVQTGGFKHLLSQNSANSIATEQGFIALVSHLRSLNGKTSFYNMSDVVNVGDTPETPENPVVPETPGNDDDQNQDDTNTGDNGSDTDNEDNNNNGNTPSTGDKSIMIYAIILIGAMATIITIINKRKKVQ